MIANARNPLTFSSIPAGKGLSQALGMSRSGILEQLRASGLKGRGGAGFPTAIKWNLAAAATGKRKFVVCNADEGEPGTFKDRLILSEFADLVFEGMTIGAYAIGASRGILYLRGEYTDLVKDLEARLLARRKARLLGRSIAGLKRFPFDIMIRLGSGAYVCGEETALIESLEGQRGEPRNRPPFPVDTGFMGQPTIVNNVETLAWIACIFARGSEWFSRLGTKQSPGLKLFSVSGDCSAPGVYEFPLGVTIQQLLKAAGGAGAKAVQIGGASGRCIPSREFERTIAFEDTPTGGSVIVFGPHRDLLKVARNFMEFFVEESCGQCTPCREGSIKLLAGIELLEQGRCPIAYLNELCRLGRTLQLASKCGLGQSSPNAFLSIVEHYRAELLGRQPPADAASS